MQPERPRLLVSVEDIAEAVWWVGTVNDADPAIRRQPDETDRSYAEAIYAALPTTPHNCDAATDHGSTTVPGSPPEVATPIPEREGVDSVREHQTDSPMCWCQPSLAYEDPLTGAKVIVHRDHAI